MRSALGMRALGLSLGWLQQMRSSAPMVRRRRVFYSKRPSPLSLVTTTPLPPIKRPRILFRSRQNSKVRPGDFRPVRYQSAPSSRISRPSPSKASPTQRQSAPRLRLTNPANGIGSQLTAGPYLETAANLWELLDRVLSLFSERAWKSLNNQADFDSTIRTCDPSCFSQD